MGGSIANWTVTKTVIVWDLFYILWLLYYYAFRENDPIWSCDQYRGFSEWVLQLTSNQLDKWDPRNDWNALALTQLYVTTR